MTHPTAQVERVERSRCAAEQAAQIRAQTRLLVAASRWRCAESRRLVPRAAALPAVPEPRHRPPAQRPAGRRRGPGTVGR